MYKVYGNVRSRAFRVMWFLEEAGQEYEFVQAAPHSATVTALNPSGKVPVLVDGDDALTDSTAIMTYLADRHGALTHPAGTLDRARQDALTQCLLDEFDALLWLALRHSAILPEDRRVPAVIDSLKWEFARNLDRLAGRFRGPFLQGDRMTVADIVATHCLNWAHAAGFPMQSDDLKAYAKAMRERDAFQRVLRHET